MPYRPPSAGIQPTFGQMMEPDAPLEQAEAAPLETQIAADPLEGLSDPITDETVKPAPAPDLVEPVQEEMFSAPETYTHSNPEDAGFMELFGNAAANETTVGNIISKMSHLLEEEDQLAGVEHDPSYDPLLDPQTAGMGAYALDYMRSRSPKQTALILKRAMTMEAQQEQLANGGWTGFAAMLAAGALDPINIIPLSGAVRAKSLLNATGVAALSGAGTGAITETLARQNQGTTRSGEEMLTAITAETLFMGAFGSAAWWLGKNAQPTDELGKTLREMMLKQMDDSEPLPAPKGAGAQGSAFDQTIADNTADFSFGVGKLQDNNTVVGQPVSRTNRSDSNDSRNISRNLAEQPEHFSGEAKREAPQAADTLYRTNWERRLFTSISQMDELFLKYRGASNTFIGAVTTGLKDARQGFTDGVAPVPGQPLTKAQFKNEIAIALRNEDKHAIPEVQVAAEIYRKEVLDPLKKAAIELELLDPDVKAKGSATYFMRVYAVEKIVSNRIQFGDILFKHFSAEREAENLRDPAFVKSWNTLADNSSLNIVRLNPLIDAKKIENSKMKRKARSLQRFFAPMIATEKAYKKQLFRFEKEFEAALGRAERMKPTGKLPADDPLVQQIEMARGILRGTIKEPERVSGVIRSLGGITDTDGTLKKLGFKTVKYKNGIIANNPDKGVSLTDMREILGDDGWVEPNWNPQKKEYDPPNEKDLLDALQVDLKGGDTLSDTPIYNMARDAEKVIAYDDAKVFIDKVKKADGDLLKMNNEQIAYKLGAIDSYVGDTKLTRQAFRNAEYYQARVRENHTVAESEFIRVRDRLTERSGKYMKQREAYTKGLTELDDMVKELRASKRLFTNYSNKLQQRDELRGLGDGDIQAAVDRTINNILANNGRGMYTPPAMGGKSLRERTLNIDDNLIADFLDNDVERVIRMHTRQMGADIELTRKFGDPSMEGALEDVTQDYNLMIEDVPDQIERLMKRKHNKLKGPERDAKFKELQEEALRRLQKGLKDDIRDIEAMRDRFTGRRALPADPNGLMHRAGIFARNFNLLRLGGGFALSSVPDIGSIAMSHGIARMVGRSGLAGIMAASKLTKLNMRETQLLGTALDLVLDTRSNNLAEIVDDYGRNSTFERGVQAVADKYGLVNGMSIWNGFMKRWAGSVSITRNLEAIEAYANGKATPKEIKRLHWLGISQEMAGRINVLAKKHGQAEDGIRWPNVQNWGPDGEAERMVFGAAIVKDVDTTIVTPGIGDKPLWLDSPTGKIVGQFRSFFLSSSVRITTRGLQELDHNTAQGMVLMIALGGLAYVLKTPSDKISEDPAVWIKEGIDRSGLMGWFMEANNMTEKFTGNTVGLSAVFGLKPAQRYASRGFIGNLLGPTAGLIDEAAGFGAAAGTGMWGEKDTERALNMIPMYKVFYLRWLREQFNDDNDPNQEDSR